MKSTSITVFYDSSINNKVATIFLEGNLEIKNAGTIKRDFITAIEKFDYMEVVLKNINKIDMGFLQLLKSMRESARKFNKTIKYDLELPEDIRSLIGT
jgi:ABC-type transporter Mla MlaB component